VTINPLDTVLDALRDRGLKVQRSGGQHEAQCPAHEDRSPSLSVGQGSDGRVLLHCQAGCPIEAVLEALNLSKGDLFEPRDEETPSATYDYVDADGKLVYQVVRKPGKQFLQRRPDGSGGWVWNLHDVQRVPYRLDLLASSTRPVYVTEGEKDADRLIREGAIATTNSGGAGKWLPQYAPHLRERDVAILPDNDAPGMDHALTVAQSLHGVAASVRIVELPHLRPKGDVSDWLNNGGSIESLRMLANKAPLFDPQAALTGGTLAELMNKDIEPIRWVVNQLLPEGLTMLAGKPKLGKSWLALLLALSVCGAQDALGYGCVGGEILYIALEDGERRLQDRVRILGADNLGHHLRRFHYRTEWRSMNQDGLEDLEVWMASHPDTRLIVIDTYGKMRGDLAGKDRYSEEYTLLGALQTFATRHRVAVLLVHHLRKQAADDWLEQLSGSQAVTGAADTLLGLFRERGQMDATLRLVSRDADEFDLALRFDNGLWESMGDATHYRISVERSEILEAIESLGGEATVSDIAELVEKTRANTSKMLVALDGDGLVRRIRRGTYSLSNPVDSVVSVDTTPTTQPTETTETTQSTDTVDQRAVLELLSQELGAEELPNNITTFGGPE